MGYDVTNNSSTVELVPGGEIPVGQNLTPIQVPDTVPTPELIAPNPVASVGETVVLPETLPSPELIGTDAITPKGDTVTIPDTIPPDGVVLLETIEVPKFLQDGGEAGTSRLEDLEDVDISGRSDGDVLAYDQTTNTYEHVTPAIADLHYIHTQGMAAQIWNITHNLGKRPAIHVEDMSGNEMIPQIIHVDNNNAQAVFGSATFSGTAYCN